MFRLMHVLVCFAPLLHAATPVQQSAPQPLQPGSPVLRLDGEDVSWAEYSHWLLENFGARMATTFAGDHLVLREARRRGVEVAPQEVESALEQQLHERIQGAFLGSKDAWLAELARTQRSEAGVRTERKQELLVDLLTRKLVAQERVVPEEKIVREWELSYGRGGRAYDLSMLFVHCIFQTPDGAEPKDVKDRVRKAELDSKQQRALALRARIAGGAEFAAVARESSDDDVSRANGGKPPQGFSHYGWPKSFLDALDRLQTGELSEPLYAKGGWWIVRVDGVRTTPLEKVRGELVRRLEELGPEQDETGRFRNALVAAASVEILPSLFGVSAGDVERAGQAPALSIDGEIVPRSSYASWILRTRGESSWPNFVEHRVVIDEARRRGVAVSDAEVRARTEEYVRRLILEGFHGSREAWLTSLELRGSDEAFFLHDLDVRMRIELLCERLIMLDRTVGGAAVRARFDEVYGKDGKLVKARMILLDVPLSAGTEGETREQMEARQTAAREAVRAKAEAIVRSIRDGGDFSSLARQHSEDPASAARGGLLEPRFRPELWPEAIARTVAGLEIGAVSDPLEFGASFVILQVAGREEVSFDVVKEDIAAQLRAEPPSRPDLSLYRNTLVKKAKVEVLPGMNP